MNGSRRFNLLFGLAAMLFTALVYAALSSKWLIISIEPSLTTRHAENALPHGLSAGMGLPSGSTAPSAGIAASSSDLFSAFPEEAMAAQEMRQFREPLVETAAGPPDLPVNPLQSQTVPPAQGQTHEGMAAPENGQAGTPASTDPIQQNRVPLPATDVALKKGNNLAPQTGRRDIVPSIPSASDAWQSATTVPATSGLVPSGRIASPSATSATATSASTKSGPATVVPASSPAYFAPSPTSGTLWMAHAGSYRTREAAFTERNRLAKAGFSAEVIVLYDTRRTPWYSLIAGAGASRRTALTICSRYTTLRGTLCTVRSFPAPKYRARAEQARR
ncbi:SPOR domain-containing protein [Desulfovibrio subterraneus]|uniref:SPOR domain-containing protein n=1 Tax=Desulfovibrio subterraneus TaxID=2718620 RepID=UPI0022B890AA|nr:SPOR domain-containing protein [Desulfovibrio subterraneus]WBF67304.1 SPOR domain-containing protein [Desulfovibrio subterraneus]